MKNEEIKNLILRLGNDSPNLRAVRKQYFQDEETLSEAER